MPLAAGPEVDFARFTDYHGGDIRQHTVRMEHLR
jgi:hypothetical protein